MGLRVLAKFRTRNFRRNVVKTPKPSWVLSILLSLGCGAGALLVGHLVSFYALPIPHPVIGPLLAATAFLLAYRQPSRWLLISLGVVLPFTAMAPYSILTLREIIETVSYRDYGLMLLPIPLGLARSLLGRLFAPRQRLNGASR